VRPSRITGIALLSSCIVLSGAVAISAKDNPLTCRPDGLNQPFSEQSASQSYALGQRFEFGQAGPVDPVRAYQWYCNAAMQGHEQSEFKVALMLLEGQGAKQDITTGVRWLNRSASKGNHDAELSLGILLEDTDAQSSAKLFERAAAGGNLYANHRLAELYYYGLGVEKDWDKALQLAQFGSQAGFEKSQELITRIRIKMETASESKPPKPVVSDAPTQNEAVVVETSKPSVVEEPVLSEEVMASESSVIVDESQSLVEAAPAEPLKDQKPEPVVETVTVIESNEPVIGSVEANDLPDTGLAKEPSSVEVVSPSPSIVDESVNAESDTLAPHVHLEEPQNKEPGFFKRMMSKLSFSSDDEQAEPSEAQSSTGHFKVVDVATIEESEPQKLDQVSELDKVVESVSQPESSDALKDTVPEAASILAASDLDQAVVAIDNDANTVKAQSEKAAVSTSPQSESIMPVASEQSIPLDAKAFQRSANWINQQPNMRYAIQLVQASQPDGIMKFIQEHQLQESAYFIHVAQDGAEKYVLLYGDYPNNRTSKAVAKTLPKAVQDNGYWIRTFGDLRRSYTIDP
jgi:septal ring-binding cell division protein DamX